MLVIPALIDLLVVLFLIVQMLLGTRRGFVLGILDLASWVVTLAFTLLLVTPLVALLEPFVSLPKGIVGLITTLVLLFGFMALSALLISKFYQLLMARHLRPTFVKTDRLLGVIPGFLNGLIITGLILELLLLIPLNTTLSDAVMDSRLGRPLATSALTVGKPFANLAQEAALDVNGYLTKKFGEPPTRLTLPVTDLSVDAAAEQKMLTLVNQERTTRGLQPLALDSKLTQIARQHSQEMLQQHYFAHDSPALGSPFDRMARAGIRYRVAGENIALAPNVDRAHTGLMNSPEHKENILRPEFRKVGIGIVNGGLSGEMFTQDFTD